MRHFEINWYDFIERLAGWERLRLDSRRLLVESKSDGKLPAAPFGRDLDSLLEQKLVALYADGRNVRWHESAREFSRAIRSISRHDLFAAPTESAVQNYLCDNFLRDEVGGLIHSDQSHYGNMFTLIHQATSDQWLQGFLAGDPRSWELARLPYRTFSDDDENECFEAAQALLHAAKGWSSPVKFCDLPERLPELSGRALAEAIRFCLRYLLLFPGMTADLTPVIGLWPGVAARLQRPRAAPPADVSPRDRFQLAYRFEDMTTLLVAVSAGGLRVRASDGGIFEKARAAVEAGLPALPSWLERFDASASAQRLHAAQQLLHEMKLVTYKRSGRNREIVAAKSAESWLGQSAVQRLTSVVEHVRPREKTPLTYDDSGRSNPELHLLESLASAFAGLAGRRFVPLENFLRWHCESANPFLELAARVGANRVRLGWTYTVPTGEQMEHQWRRILLHHFTERLLPLGGVEVGVCSDDALCFALTDVGRFMLGMAENFEYGPAEETGDEVVVQPNFDIVFLKPSPLAEATIARFAERRSSGVGAQFKITKASVLNAAGSGQSQQQIFETLRRFCAKGIPRNVEREIAGWFASCRRIGIKSAIVIHCPDPQTAARIVAASGRKASLLNDTVIELKDAKFKPNLLKKLRAEGIFEETAAKRREASQSLDRT